MDIADTQRAMIAAQNNADLYAAMFAAHGLRFRRLPHAFVGLDAPPPYYSNLTTLSPDAVEGQLAEIRTLAARFGGRMGLKDSFCQLDLQAAGFDVLFQAEWLWHDPGTGGTVAPGWCRIKNATDLALWEESWKRDGSPTDTRMFPEGMLALPDIAFFGRKSGDGFDAGCIGNMSADCIGLSNVFGAESIQSAAAAVSALDSARPLVGYATGESLQQMRGGGFKMVGALRVWVANTARF